jgi:hypothetical protein
MACFSESHFTALTSSIGSRDFDATMYRMMLEAAYADLVFTISLKRFFSYPQAGRPNPSMLLRASLMGYLVPPL